jgi:hypothetical protein
MVVQPVKRNSRDNRQQVKVCFEIGIIVQGLAGGWEGENGATEAAATGTFQVTGGTSAGGEEGWMNQS